jgi:hypothetical protein
VCTGIAAAADQRNGSHVVVKPDDSCYEDVTSDSNDDAAVNADMTRIEDLADSLVAKLRAPGTLILYCSVNIFACEKCRLHHVSYYFISVQQCVITVSVYVLMYRHLYSCRISNCYNC